jgi:glycine/D-amino acid oxidase-like deaminating enzyme
MKNNSPWLHQLNKERKIALLKSDLETDVAIVGGGIAGISTAFFLLRNTDKKVVLLEGGQLGHGATGHNGGHITANFERPFSEMVKDSGLVPAAAGSLRVCTKRLLIRRFSSVSRPRKQNSLAFSLIKLE